ncbi:hypothetical protein HW532_20800 [Kaustia mangrovi]|uniref:Uncharacterized protein n=1 Tax=Kaustia mangrovi TaxID=2593653 RepID=A0A7S8C7Q4_9HYPH|nr:hypothetical protein [Kaustia mangrovi]QPC44919.1 hypothetical protein HW532_20800 [Kaustia mangrovi]
MISAILLFLVFCFWYVLCGLGVFTALFLTLIMPALFWLLATFGLGTYLITRKNV